MLCSFISFTLIINKYIVTIHLTIHLTSHGVLPPYNELGQLFNSMAVIIIKQDYFDG